LFLAVVIARGSPAADGVVAIEPQGMLFRECSLPGESRADRVVPRHANCLQVSRQRWLVIYSTHGYRGVDDERSIVYQLRRDAPDGAILKEGFLARAINDWQPAGVAAAPPGLVWFKQHGHMVGFGVPKGAVVNGKIPPQANQFAVCWRVLGRPLDLARGYLQKSIPDSELYLQTRGVEWIQFRLNDAEDDLEFLGPAKRLRQRGYESGDKFCSAEGAVWMNQSFCMPVALSAEGNEWGVCNHFDNGRLAVVKFQFDLQSKRYAWVETGHWISAHPRPLSEASLVPLNGGKWLVTARSNGQIAWSTASDPLGDWEPVQFLTEPSVSAPHTTYQCGDGTVRLLTGDKRASPQKYDRDPLYVWDLAGDPLMAASRQVILDSQAAGLKIRPEARAKLDFAEMFPHHGRTQLIVFGVSTRAFDFAYPGTNIPPVRDDEIAVSGLYCTRIVYQTEPSPRWTFDKAD
jgi:hypothetical protein